MQLRSDRHIHGRAIHLLLPASFSGDIASESNAGDLGAWKTASVRGLPGVWRELTSSSKKPSASAPGSQELALLGQKGPRYRQSMLCDIGRLLLCSRKHDVFLPTHDYRSSQPHIETRYPRSMRNSRLVLYVNNLYLQQRLAFSCDLSQYSHRTKNVKRQWLREHMNTHMNTHETEALCHAYLDRRSSATEPDRN